MKKINLLYAAAVAAMTMTACSDDNVSESGEVVETDAGYIGQAVGNFAADEWYPGGRLGTTESTVSGCYEDPAPAVEQQGLTEKFFIGEQLFERQYTINTGAFKGVGPASTRRSCLDCHPGYGHGKRTNSYTTSYGNGNGYLLVVYHPIDGMNSNDGPYISEVTGMPQTQANKPFLPPIDESQIRLTWHTVAAMESGLPLKFPDGESYELVYPELYIPQSAFNTLPKPENLAFRLESTIGIIGTGLIDAIPSDSIVKQYETEAKRLREAGLDVAEYLNPNFWDETTRQVPEATAYYPKFNKDGIAGGTFADGGTYEDNPQIKRFTYALTRGPLMDGPGANAIWNITNVSRADRPRLYTTKAWADAMAANDDVVSAIQGDPSSPYYADGTKEGIRNAVSILLNPATDQFDNLIHPFAPDQSMENFHSFLVWHRGLAIPRARNLNDPQVQRGKQVFMEIGCASCHRPKWQTTDDNYATAKMIADKKLPRYRNQTIYPYSDFVQHKLYMKNDIHGSWCRTTPLWGRGLSLVNTGAEDRMHDCRARNEVEAIMWHAYSRDSHAYGSAEKFYRLPKSDRDAVVRFLRSI